MKSGPDKLKKFYTDFQPSNLVEMYALNSEGLLGEDLPPWEIPWIARDKRLPPPGELGLDATHGVSYYGPATPEKIALEYKRLINTRSSIQKYGFLPDMHGDIEGYGLVSENDYRFFVRGGKHRLAVLASLGWTKIPVSFRHNWPTSIYSVGINDWPLVKDKKISKELALSIFNIYFDV